MTAVLLFAAWTVIALFVGVVIGKVIAHADTETQPVTAETRTPSPSLEAQP